jgi:hypothetical protein
MECLLLAQSCCQHLCRPEPLPALMTHACWCTAQVDELALDAARKKQHRDGATAVCILRLGEVAYVAHAGEGVLRECRTLSCNPVVMMHMSSCDDGSCAHPTVLR